MAVAAPTSLEPASARPAHHQHQFLDGLRGIAALAVALHHAFLFTGSSGQAERDLPALAPVFGLGQYGVSLFIVLSGFVLALPVARTPDLTLRGGTIGFLRRRARRILPPYFVALLAFAVVILVVPGLNERAGTAWDSKVPIDTRAFATHLLLVHNLDPHSVDRIDGPLWSVATEWQLYFLLPFLLIPLWRRFGALAAAAIGTVLGIGAWVIVREFAVAHPWFLGLFAFGVVAATMVERGWAPQRPRLLAGACLAAATALHLADLGRPALRELLFGVGFAAALVAMTTVARAGRSTLALRFFGDRRIVGVGLFSYSIYLVHSPLIAWFNLATRNVEMSTALRLVMLVGVAIPLAVAIAYAFFLAVERHFLSGHQTAVTGSAPKRRWVRARAESLATGS